MEQWKLDEFARSHPGRTIHISRAADGYARRLKAMLAAKLGVRAEGGLVILEALRSSSVPLASINAEDSSFTLDLLLSRAGIVPRETVLVNWYRFEELDEVPVAELSEFFDDVWHPGADDVEVLDASLEWVLLVDHSGSLAVVRLPPGGLDLGAR